MGKAGGCAAQRDVIFLTIIINDIYLLSFTCYTIHFSCAEVIPVAAHHDKTGEYPHAVFEKAWELGLVNPHVSSVNTPTAFLILSACLRRNNFRDATISRRALYTLAPSVLDQTMVAYLHA